MLAKENLIKSRWFLVYLSLRLGKGETPYAVQKLLYNPRYQNKYPLQSYCFHTNIIVFNVESGQVYRKLQCLRTRCYSLFIMATMDAAVCVYFMQNVSDRYNNLNCIWSGSKDQNFYVSGLRSRSRVCFLLNFSYWVPKVVYLNQQTNVLLTIVIFCTEHVMELFYVPVNLSCPVC